MRASLTLAAVAAACFAPIGVAQAQVSGACTRLEGQSAPGVVEAVAYTALFEQGRVAAITLRLPNGRDSTTYFSRVRDEPGRSMRFIVFPRNNTGQPPSYTIVFNQATVEPGGTVLVETWLRTTNRPAQEPPLHNWYRIRCDGTAPPPPPAAPVGPAAPTASGGLRK